MGRRAKFGAIAEELRERIARGEFASGEAMPPERQLADEFGVTRLTLRKAMEVLADEGVVSRQQGRGTIVTATGLTARPATIVYVGSTREHFFQSIHSRLCAEAQDRNQAVVAFTPTEQEEDLPHFRALMRDASAVVCMAGMYARLAPVIPEDVRVVLFSSFESVEPGAHPQAGRGWIVSTDTYRAAKLAVEHLKRRGHRRIGLIDAGVHPPGRKDVWRIQRHRTPYLGYRSALREAGIEDEFLVATPPNPAPGEDWHETDARVARQQLAAMDAIPSAFVCVGDYRAAPLTRALDALGLKVPSDVSLVGMGDTPWAGWLTPPLTTVALGEAEMARLAMLLVGEPEPSRPHVFRVDPYIVERKSVQSHEGG